MIKLLWEMQFISISYASTYRWVWISELKVVVTYWVAEYCDMSGRAWPNYWLADNIGWYCYTKKYRPILILLADMADINLIFVDISGTKSFSNILFSALERWRLELQNKPWVLTSETKCYWNFVFQSAASF